MAQFWIVGGGGVGLAVSPQRIPRRLASGCALHGASLSLVWPRESNQREGHPDIRVSLRETALPPVPLRGPSRRDVPVPSFLARRPCLASPCATPPLGLLTGTAARPNLPRLACYRTTTSLDHAHAPRGHAATDAPRLRDAERPWMGSHAERGNHRCVHGLLGWDRVPSGGRVESTWKGIGGRDAAKGVKGLGCPLYAGPWNGDGAREVWRRSRQTRMSGGPSLWLLSLCTGKEKVTRREGEKRS